jgi:hypothetical protein
MATTEFRELIDKGTRLRRTVESSRLQKEVADLDCRMAKLDESARRLESDSPLAR